MIFDKNNLKKTLFQYKQNILEFSKLLEVIE